MSYIQKVKELLYCNATEEYKNNNITYLFTNDEIDKNIDYFLDCEKNELSSYKSLLFFYDYLNTKND
jgi:hypothetical protein